MPSKTRQIFALVTVLVFKTRRLLLCGSLALKQILPLSLTGRGASHQVEDVPQDDQTRGLQDVVEVVKRDSGGPNTRVVRHADQIQDHPQRVPAVGVTEKTQSA